MDGAVLLDVDLGARLLLDAADHLAAAADDVADLVHRDVDRLDAGRELRELLARRLDGLQHGVQDVGAALARLRERAGQDLDEMCIRDRYRAVGSARALLLAARPQGADGAEEAWPH